MFNSTVVGVIQFVLFDRSPGGFLSQEFDPFSETLFLFAFKYNLSKRNEKIKGRLNFSNTHFIELDFFSILCASYFTDEYKLFSEIFKTPERYHGRLRFRF